MKSTLARPTRKERKENKSHKSSGGQDAGLKTLDLFWRGRRHVFTQWQLPLLSDSGPVPFHQLGVWKWHLTWESSVGDREDSVILPRPSWASLCLTSSTLESFSFWCVYESIFRNNKHLRLNPCCSVINRIKKGRISILKLTWSPWCHRYHAPEVLVKISF